MVRGTTQVDILFRRGKPAVDIISRNMACVSGGAYLEHALPWRHAGFEIVVRTPAVVPRMPADTCKPTITDGQGAGSAVYCVGRIQPF